MLAAALAVFAGTVFAANPDCKSPANEKKSFGAARSSFVTNRAKDAIGVAVAR
jgi:hypothetical protein